MASTSRRPPALVLFLAEARMLLRDRRTVFTALLLPILVLPLVFAVQDWSLRQRDDRLEERKLPYAVVGAEASLARELIAEGSAAIDERDEASEDDAPRIALDEVAVASLDEALARLEEGALDAVIDAGLAAEDAAGELPLLRIHFRGDRDASGVARGALRARLDAARAFRRAEALEGVGLDVAVADLARVAERRDLASAGQRTGAAYGRGAVLFLLFFLLTGGSVVAADSLAGEKERGTLETLLTSAAERRDIVVAKLALIVAVGVVITVAQVLNLWLYLGLRILDLPDDFALELSASSAVWLLLLLLPLAVLVAGILLLASGRAAGYKDFQVRFFPLFLLTVAPALAAFLPGVPLRSGIVLVPIANVAVGTRELLSGIVDVPALVIAVVVSWAVAVLVVRSTLDVLGTERLVTSARVDRAAFVGGAAVFPRRVVAWFAAMWVVIFLSSSLVETLHAQLFLNLVVVFFGTSLLMLRIYRLDVREALSLRAPPAAVWPAVVVGAPATLLAMGVVGKLSERLFPVPRELLEAFARDLLPAGTPLWQLVLLVAVLPGITEEVAFRGVLLHGLRARMRPWAAILAVGLVFGFFHISAIRILPTALLGVLFGALTVWTRSLYPAIAWHTLNNAGAIVAGRVGLDVTDVDPRLTAAAVVVSALSILWIWRLRRPPPATDPRGGPSVRDSTL